MNAPTLDETVQARFREVMAGVATPVSVVTASAGGRPHGTTVSAFASLSMDPPMVLVSLDRASDLLALVREAGGFGVNVLGADQSALALAFARKGSDKFDGVPWGTDHGLPRLQGAPGWLACEVAGLVDGGDHVIALGVVVCADTLTGQPLTYHGRVFGTHTALDPVDSDTAAVTSGVLDVNA
jgi:flavin reductase (DIM6/NTAB) family NADH-FMN oxidoreductase RutF